MRSPWSPGNKPQSLYRYYDEEHQDRMGCCKYLPSDGDLCLCLTPVEDCFDDYVVLWVDDDGLYSVLYEFSAYKFGEEICNLSNRAFHLLLAGETIALELEIIRGNKS